MACFIVSEVELTPKTEPKDEITPEDEQTNVKGERKVVETNTPKTEPDKAPVIPKRLQNTFKNMNARQREIYDNANNDPKISVLETIREEKRRGVCDYMFR